jgi:hypothetical protein
MRLVSEGSSRSAAPAGESGAIHVISVIIPVLRDDGALAEVHRAYRAAFDRG